MSTPTPTLVVAASKPQAIGALRATWRKSAEHKAAQLKRFLLVLGGVLIAQIVPEVLAGKDPLVHFTDARTAWFYLLPFAAVAWRQLHPAMTASQADQAPGVTIVPDQVGLPADPVPPVLVEVPMPPDPFAPHQSVELTPADEHVDLSTIPLDLDPKGLP